MEFIGHRACAAHNPQNTIAAAKDAADHLNAIEIDVRRCGSDEIVVFHDERVDELTDGEGRLDELDWSTVRRLRVEASDERVPRLAALLDAVCSVELVQIELKEPGLESDVKSILADHDYDVRVTSFSPAALAAVCASDWAVSTGLLFGASPDANLALARRLDCTTVHPSVGLCLETDVVRRAHDEGFEVYAWNLSDYDTIADLEARGVDGVTTDRWDVPPAGNR